MTAPDPTRVSWFAPTRPTDGTVAVRPEGNAGVDPDPAARPTEGDQMSETVTFEASIPPEPVGLRIVTDKDGDVWQRMPGEDGWLHGWRCVRAKIPGLLVSQQTANWRHLVYAFGPITAVQYDREDVPGGAL